MRRRQHGTSFIFFTKCWLEEPTFREKDLASSTLPEAISTSGFVTA
jgi:hypothetical protein